MADESIQLVVGLGNPGQQYDSTRHNAGFWYADALARRYQSEFRIVSRFFAEVAAFECGGEKVWLLKPTTFMNLSGQAVGAFVRYYNIPSSRTVVAYDEIDLPSDVIRLKKAGGHGGHNGLRDIFAHFDKEFWRLRIGVGHPGHKDQVVNYVLGTPSKHDRELIDQNIQRAVDVFPEMQQGRMQMAMNTLHTRENH